MIRVGVLRGGIGPRYEESLQNGGRALSLLRDEKLNKKYQALDIFLDKDGVWHLFGLPTSLEKISHNVDVVFNTLHGEYGEDGKLQQVLENWKIPYTGSDPLPSALVFSHQRAREELKNIGVKMPRYILVSAYQEDFDGPRDEYAIKKAREVFEKLSPPWILRPLDQGSSLGVHICKTMPELIHTFEYAEISESSVIVEEMIFGKTASVGVIKGFRGNELYTLPAIDPKNSQNLSANHFTKEEKAELERLASDIHNKLYLGHFSKSDFVVAPKNGIYSLSISTLPKIGDQETLTKSLQDVGSNESELIDHLIELALKKK